MYSDQAVYDLLAGVAGIIISLLLTYVPGMRTWYAGLDAVLKRVVLLGALALAAGLVVASSCLNLWVFVACEKAGFMSLAEAFVIALVANQSTYTLSKPPADVALIKEQRKA